MLAPKRLAALPPLSGEAMTALINPQQNPEAPNMRTWRAAEIPAANGHASATGRARLYAALAGEGELDGIRILSPNAGFRLRTPVTSSGRTDLCLGFTDSWGLGMAVNRPGIYGNNPRIFGHSGWGGSFGRADLDAQAAIGHVCNQKGPERVGDPRTAGLCAQCCVQLGIAELGALRRALKPLWKGGPERAPK